VLVAAPSKGWKSVADLVAAAKAKPGALNFASAGVGSASHWAAERFRLASGIDVQHIPFRGPVEAFTEVMTGRVDFYYLPIAPALPNIRDGKIVALAVSTPKRAGAAVAYGGGSGLSGGAYLFWGSLALPAAPRAIVDRLHEDAKALNVPAIRRAGDIRRSAVPMSVDQFDKFYRDDVAARKLARTSVSFRPMIRVHADIAAGAAIRTAASEASRDEQIDRVRVVICELSAKVGLSLNAPSAVLFR
jgi:hypothetical protein